MDRCKHDLVESTCATCTGTDLAPSVADHRRVSACSYDRGNVEIQNASFPVVSYVNGVRQEDDLDTAEWLRRCLGEAVA